VPAAAVCDRTFHKFISANLPSYKFLLKLPWEKIPAITVLDSSTHERDGKVSLEKDSVQRNKIGSCSYRLKAN
jgi:hypothetical protein